MIVSAQKLASTFTGTGSNHHGAPPFAPDWARPPKNGQHLEGLSQWLDGNGEHPQPFALRDFGKELLAELNDYAGKDSKLSQYTHEQQLQYYSASLLTQLDKIDRFTGSNLLQIGMADDVQYYAVQQSLVMSGKMARNLGKELGGEHELSESLAEISNNSNRLIHRYGDTDATIVRKACASLAEIEPHLNDLNHATSLPAKTQQAATAGPAFADKRQRSPTPPEEGAVNMGAAMAAIVAGKVPPASLDPPPGDDRVKAPITPIDAKAQAIKRAAIGERK